MLLTAKVREKSKKKDAKRLRRLGDIPAVIYAAGKPTEMLQVSGREFTALVRTIPTSHLSTTKIVLDIAGTKKTVIVKDIQYHPMTYDVVHLDFEELFDEVPINVNVPINCTGVMECTGVKLGGVLRQVIRQVKVHCLPKVMPTSFEVDVKHLNVGQSLRLSDIEIPEGIRPLANLREVVVVIATR